MFAHVLPYFGSCLYPTQVAAQMSHLTKTVIEVGLDILPLVKVEEILVKNYSKKTNTVSKLRRVLVRETHHKQSEMKQMLHPNPVTVS